MLRRSQGFTLIEIAIVLVIIGLLLGGVLKGQELITGARVRNLISQQEGIKAAFFGFQDRYRALPGDYAAASTNINCSGGCPGGDGNGRIEGPNVGGSHEEIFAWTHLASAGFLNGSYAAASAVAAPADDNTPKNPYSQYVQVVYDDVYGDPGGTSPSKHNVKTGSQVPVEIIAEVDRKIDDGKPYAGSFQFSIYSDSTAPDETLCIQTGNWFIAQSETNCGGASLL
ncbi:MAG TPA: prepilin-type N-terminal cleavage/methylation domain-containing protein [Burkholderiales bacterium]|jgi:prepilin-type N-terminal cleavage/methylation domain-containing protein